jgi:adenylate cyclase
LNPIPPGWYLIRLGDAYRLTGQYEKAVREYKKAIQLQPNDMFSHLCLAVTYVYLGQEENAHAEAEEVLRINPKFSVESHGKYIKHKDDASKKLFIGGMRKAGLPE